MSQTVAVYERSELRDGLRINWHVSIPMDDGIVLCADVFRPVEEGRYPIIMTHGPYAKGLAFQDGYRLPWERLVQEHPDVAAGSTNQYQTWETVDPEKWVPDGYACVRVDSRGAGWSPGVLDVWSPRETQDLYNCIEWCAAQPWSNGRIGLCGISYYAMNQWQVAGLQPPHLTAMCAWEGAADWYRDVHYHGGILSDFGRSWFPRQVVSVQYGLGDRAAKSRVTHESVAGPRTLSDEELASNRVELQPDVKKHPLDDEWHKARSANWNRVRTPFLSAGNWGGAGLHARGNFEAFTQARSEQKWLEVHGLSHCTHFYTDYGVKLQKRFFGHFLKGEDTGWDRQPRAQLQVRHVDRFVERHENEWPLARTQWTRHYLNIADLSLGTRPPAAEGSISFDGFGAGVTFSTANLENETEVTGPIAAKVFIASSTSDADIFLTLRLFDASGQEICFQGADDPNAPIAQGWLRSSQRKLDGQKTLPYRPYHSHDEIQPLAPGQVYELDVEIWPSCIVIPAGYRLALTVAGKDYETSREQPDWARGVDYVSKGCGPFTHTDPENRSKSAFAGKVTLHSGGARASYMMLPIVPRNSNGIY
jgi:uncharacterized protein